MSADTKKLQGVRYPEKSIYTERAIKAMVEQAVGPQQGRKVFTLQSLPCEQIRYSDQEWSHKRQSPNHVR